MTVWHIAFEHNIWATHTLLRACASLTPEQLDRPFEMGPGSVRKTLLHMASAQIYWTDRLLDRARADAQYPGETHRAASVDEIAKLHQQTSAEFQQVALSLIEGGKLAETIKASPRPEAHPIRIASVLYHVCHHGTHHRAQILNMLRHLGVRPLPAIDVDDWEQTL